MVLLDNFPIWVVYLGTVAMQLLVAEIGFRIGIRIQRRDPSAEGQPITNTVVGGVLALLAFIIALPLGSSSINTPAAELWLLQKPMLWEPLISGLDFLKSPI